VSGRPPALDLELEAAVQDAVREAVRTGIAASAHDCSEGGIAIALAESCLAGGIGADVHLPDDVPLHAALFSETQSRVVVTCAEDDVDALLELCDTAQVPYAVIGTVGGDELVLEGVEPLSVAELRSAWEPTLERLVHGG
jgi:phosphoribosylformylglycinamidine synthase